MKLSHMLDVSRAFVRVTRRAGLVARVIPGNTPSSLQEQGVRAQQNRAEGDEGRTNESKEG
jgi:hypothetical protein